MINGREIYRLAYSDDVTLISNSNENHKARKCKRIKIKENIYKNL